MRCEEQNEEVLFVTHVVKKIVRVADVKTVKRQVRQVVIVRRR